MRKIDLYLACSPMEIVSGLACISETRPSNPVFLIERSVTFNQTAIESIISNAAGRYPEVSFKLFSLEWSDLGGDLGGKWILGRRLRWLRELKASLDSAVQEAFGTPLHRLGDKVGIIHFCVLHNYVRILLEACRQCPRALYPHGFDFPRKQQLRDMPFLFRSRGLRTWLGSLPHMKTTTGPGELMISTLYRMWGGRATCVPYTGTDRVYTFRSSIPEVDTEVVVLRKLKETFQWLITIPPHRVAMDKARQDIPPRSIILLLGEYDRNPIWEENRNWAEAHLSLARATLLKTGAESLVIKAHPRSDGRAATYLHDFFKSALPETPCYRLPEELSVLPIEALAVGLRSAAACSLGSCSLPGGIGIDVPHFTSPDIGEFFDQGWKRVPFWLKYEDAAWMLIDEGICQEVIGQPRA